MWLSLLPEKLVRILTHISKSTAAFLAGKVAEDLMWTIDQTISLVGEHKVTPPPLLQCSEQ